MSETITIPKSVLAELVQATRHLIDECNSNADFGEAGGRGHASEDEAVEECDAAVGVAQAWLDGRV